RAAGQGEVEADELPGTVDAEASGLDRIAAEVALEVPGVDADVELADDPAAVAVALDLDDAIDHEHRRRRDAQHLGRRILDERPLPLRDQLLAVEGGPLEVLRVPHVRIR